MSSHVSRVRVLYKSILRLHRGLPPEVRALGDQYVKDEFRRHKDAESEFVPTFMNEWTSYALTLAKQLGVRTSQQTVGLPLHEDQMEVFTAEQLAQLFELYKETQKPVNPDNPLGYNPNAPNTSPS